MSTYTFNGTGELTQAIVTNADLAGNNISKVVISGYTSIGDQAFYQATTMTSITIPASVTSIGDEAFYQATALTSITIPSGVTSIGPYTFYDASSLTSITIPASVTSIGDSAFQDASSLTSVTFRTGSQLTSIGTYAFRRASSLISITIPSGVTTIGSGTFQDATALTSITIPASVNAIEGYAFAGASALTSIIIPSGVISIGEQAFVSASSLTSIIIPSSVTTIGDDAFFISGLTQATINAARLGEANFPTAVGPNQTIGGKSGVTILAAITQENIQTAVNDWVANQANAQATYGHIKDWDTSNVTDMSNLFSGKTTFNNDVSQWNTSNVTSMVNMFRGATVFKRNISRWTVGATVPLTNMFKNTPMGTNGTIKPKSDTPPLSYFNKVPCFDQDTLILCPTGNICVKDLKVGDEVVTSSGVKRILRIGNRTRPFNGTGNISTTMFRMKETDDMTGDLLVTGSHAILLDAPYLHFHGDCKSFTDAKKIDGKYPIIAGLYHKFEMETIPREHTIYHIAIDGAKNRYGLIANGVLMESWDKKQASM